MKNYYDVEQRRFRISRTDDREATSLFAKRGDSQSMRILPMIGDNAHAYAGLTEMIFAVKSVANDATPLLMADDFTRDGATGDYVSAMVQDISAIETLLAATTDGFIDVYGELTVTDTTYGTVTSKTVDFRIYNDLWKGSEGTPLTLPTPEEWLEARAVLYTAQTLSSPEQVQARANIDAAGTGDLHAAATVVTGTGLSISGQAISLSIGTGSNQVAAGIHTHDYSGGTITNLPLIRVAPSGATAGSLASNVDGTGQAARDALGAGAVDLQSSRSISTRTASGIQSFIAGGGNNTASGGVSYAEGSFTTASGTYSHSEGRQTIASGTASHAQGFRTEASGAQGHAEGKDTTASGASSHAEGFISMASGLISHAAGCRAKAIHDGSRVMSDTQDADVESTTTNQMTCRYANGYSFLGGNAVFVGAVTGSNLSGTNTGDQDLSSYATLTGTETLTNKTLTNPSVNNYTEGVVAIGTVTTAHTIALTNGTVQTATLTASTACAFTMPTATAGKSFILYLKQAASTGNGTATFGVAGPTVKWAGGVAPVITATAGRMDILSFVGDGTHWYGSVIQNYTP